MNNRIGIRFRFEVLQQAAPLAIFCRCVMISHGENRKLLINAVSKINLRQAGKRYNYGKQFNKRRSAHFIKKI